MARGIFDAYLQGEASQLYPAHFADAKARAHAVRAAAGPLAPAVHAALIEQNAALSPSEARTRNLEALRTGAAAVVTGQQVGLFLGPLFTLYKALTAVVLAERLGAETGQPVVPVFWVQSEDHDLPEVASVCCSVAGPTTAAPLELRLPSDPGDRVSLEHQRLPKEIDEILARLERALGERPFAAAHLERLRRHYRPGAGYARAFTGLLAELTADFGLVFLNPRDPALAACAVPVHQRALLDASPLARRLLERRDQIERDGYEAPVHVRPDAPLAFFHPEGPEGPRYRLVPAEGGFALQGGPAGVWPLPRLLERLEDEPRSFSTSALLRPLLQDALLPTAAYVGGPAEIAYLAQVHPLYEVFELAPPLLVPRARLFVLEPETCRALDALGLSALEVSASESALLERLGAADAGPKPSAGLETEVLAPLLAGLDARQAELSALGPGVERALHKTRESVAQNLGRLIGKVRAAELAHDETRLRRVRGLRAALYPGGVPQERRLGLSEFAARHGEREFVRRVHDAIDPFSAKIGEVRP